MPATKNNFSHITNVELEGVATSSFTVDFINTLSEGPLADGNTQKTYTVRTDSLGTLISGNTLRDAIRALNGAGSVTATISSATVTATDVAILTAAVV